MCGSYLKTMISLKMFGDLSEKIKTYIEAVNYA